MQFLAPIRIEEDDSELIGELFAVEFEVLAPEENCGDSYKSEMVDGIAEADKRIENVPARIDRLEVQNATC